VLFLLTVVETPAFWREAAATLTEEERAELVWYLAANPEAGEIMSGTGGARKLRWRAQGRGKRGGTRAIYYCHDESLLRQERKTDLTKAEQNEIKNLLPQLVAGYRKRRSK